MFSGVTSLLDNVVSSKTHSKIQIFYTFRYYNLYCRSGIVVRCQRKLTFSRFCRPVLFNQNDLHCSPISGISNCWHELHSIHITRKVRSISAYINSNAILYSTGGGALHSLFNMEGLYPVRESHYRRKWISALMVALLVLILVMLIVFLWSRSSCSGTDDLQSSTAETFTGMESSNVTIIKELDKLPKGCD